MSPLILFVAFCVFELWHSNKQVVVVPSQLKFWSIPYYGVICTTSFAVREPTLTREVIAEMSTGFKQEDIELYGLLTQRWWVLCVGVAILYSLFTVCSLELEPSKLYYYCTSATSSIALSITGGGGGGGGSPTSHFFRWLRWCCRCTCWQFL